MEIEYNRFTCDWGKSVKCNSCKYYLGFAKCKAFPDLIPKEVMLEVDNSIKYQCSEKYHFEENK